MESMIRWKRGDYIRLGRAISRFNQIINEIEVDESLLPPLQNYKEVKANILSRKELNRVINSMNKANVNNLSKTREFASGEKVTQWEFGEINKATKRALRRLENERENILSTRKSIGMGDERLSEINAMEQSFENLENKRSSEFERVKKRVFLLGRQDYALKKAETFRENFYNALEHLSNFENYDKLKKELDKIQNPLKFFEYVKQSPQLMDIFIYYLSPETNIYGAFSSNQEAFSSSLLYHLGIKDVNV